MRAHRLALAAVAVFLVAGVAPAAANTGVVLVQTQPGYLVRSVPQLTHWDYTASGGCGAASIYMRETVTITNLTDGPIQMSDPMYVGGSCPSSLAHVVPPLGSMTFTDPLYATVYF